MTFLKNHRRDPKGNSGRSVREGSSRTSLTFSFVFSFIFGSILLSSIASATNVGVSLLETPESVVISPSEMLIRIRATDTFTATATFSSSSPDLNVTTNNFTQWSSDNENVVVVNSSGMVTAVEIGSATVTVTYGGKSDSALVTVVPEASPPPSPSPSSSGGRNSNNRITSSDGRENPPVPTPPPTERPSERPVSPENPLSPPTEPRVNPENIPPRPENPSVPESSPPLLAPLDSGISDSPLPTPPAPPSPPESPSVLIETDRNLPSSENDQIQTIFNDETLIGFFPANLDFDKSPDTAIIQTDFGPVILPSDLSVSRGEILHKFLKILEVEKVYQDLLDTCSLDLESCLSIFLNTTSFEGVTLKSEGDAGERAISWWRGFIATAVAAAVDDFSTLQLYPDVKPSWPYARDVNVATVLGIVQGYYTEANSPFKPQQALTRMEAVKISLGAVRMVKWMYYDELEALLGGPIGIKSQKTPFADVTQDKTYMWWYPRYLNKACEIQMIDCTPGRNFRPQDYITDAELKIMLDNLKNYTDTSNYLGNQNADTDGDKIKNYLEQSVYFTNFENPDTDDDKLLDGEEIFTFKTNPFLKDSDFDALDDYQEINRYKTNPLSADTDGDGFYDSVEIQAKTDPLDHNSFPEDRNGNFIDDLWEKKYNLDQEVIDTDDDGVADAIEYQFATNPLQKDTDGDGFSDAQELLELRTDPLNAQDPGSIEKLGVRITNLDENQTIADNTPFIQGVAPADSQVRILLRNDFGAEKVLGDVLSSENSIFTFQVQKPLRSGRYQVVARVLQPSKKAVIDSTPVHIIINPDASVNAPKPDKLADEIITDDVLLKQVRVEIEDRKPVLVGKLEKDFGSKVTATWKSVVATSALIADNVSGEFRIASPRQLELGNHEVYVTAIRHKDGVQSKTIRIPFVIGPSLNQPDLKSAADERISSEVASSGWLFGAFLGASILAFTFACLQHSQKKKGKS